MTSTASPSVQLAVGFVIGGLTFVAGNAWSIVFDRLLDVIFPEASSSNRLLVKFVYAVLVTALVVALVIWLSQYFHVPPPPPQPVPLFSPPAA